MDHGNENPTQIYLDDWENDEKPPVSLVDTRFEPGTSQIRVQCVTTVPFRLVKLTFVVVSISRKINTDL